MFPRTLPPAAAPIPVSQIISAQPSCFRSASEESRFAQEIKQEFGIKHCFLVSSGKTALTIILQALKSLNPEREYVLIPAYTCYSVPAAIKRAGLKIMLCDLAPDSLDFDLEQLKNIIESDKKEEKILCVLATHLFGCPVDISAIKSVVTKEIPVVEDAAQAMGEEIEEKKLGTLSDVGFYSLGRGKALSTMEGGVIVTDNDAIAGKVKALVNSLPEYSPIDSLKLFVKALLTTILQRPSLFWLPKALPFLKLGETIYEPDFAMRKMSPFQMKLAENWQARLERHRKARLNNIRFWLENLPSFLTALCKTDVYALIRFPVLADTVNMRDEILHPERKMTHTFTPSHLPNFVPLRLGIMPMYPTPVNNIPEISSEFDDVEYPNAQDICDRLLTLPVHEFVGSKDRMKIINSICTSIQNSKLTKVSRRGTSIQN